MHTSNTRTTANSAYEDFRTAIAQFALVRAQDAVIVASERTGARDQWIFDFRAFILQPTWLDRYAEIFWEQYGSRLPFQVGGLETAGIPLVAAIVMKSVERGTPVNGFYLRKSRKRQGLMKNLEGTLTDEPIVFVDDLINSGQSMNKQIDILTGQGKTVSEAFVLLAFREKSAYDFFEKKKVAVSSLFTLTDFGIPLLAPKTPEVPRDSFDVLWRYEASKPSHYLVVQKSTPVLDDTRIYFGCDDGTFRALDQATGALAWEFRTGRHPVGKGILSSPALHKGVVYFGAYDGCVYALDAATSRILWKYDDADWVGSSPAVAPRLGLVFIGLEYGLWGRRGGISALDMKTGRAIWTAHHPQLTHGSPLYIPEEGLVVIGSNDGVLYAYEAENGNLRWFFATRGDIKASAAYDTKRRAILVGSMDGTLYAVSADGVPLHAYETDAGIYGSPCVSRDIAYVASLDKCLYAIDCLQWKRLWTFETRGRIFASPTIEDGSLWIGSNDGRLYELDPQAGTLKNFFQATERIVNKVAHRTGRIFVATSDNGLYSLKKRESPPPRV